MKLLRLVLVLLCTLLATVLALPIGALHRVALLHRITRLWGRLVMRLLGVRLQITHGERAQLENVIYIVNHTSLLDTFAYPAILPAHTRYVSKVELEFLVPIIWLCKKMGHIFLDRRNPRSSLRMLQEMALARPRNTPLFIHPEGTRSTDGSILPFKSGITMLVKHARCGVVPVVSTGGEQLWPKGKFMSDTGVLRISFGEEVPFTALEGLDKDALAELLRAKMVQIQGLTN